MSKLDNIIAELLLKSIDRASGEVKCPYCRERFCKTCENLELCNALCDARFYAVRLKEVIK